MQLSSTLTDEHVETWRRDGYCIVENFVRPDIVEATVEQIHEHLPTWEQFTHERDAWPEAEAYVHESFPFREPLRNQLVVNPELISFARRVIGDDDIVLSHSESMAKYANEGEAEFHQRMHTDYGNNTFVVPMRDRVEQLASITYLTDVTIELGPTKVVSRADAAGWQQRLLTRDEAPELFAAERAITVPAGSIFLYGMDTYHRGSAMTASEGLRHSLHIAYQRRSMTWGGWREYVRSAPADWMNRLMTDLSPDQRTMIGFPPIGDDYWTPESIAAVQHRYPEMDLSPYSDE